VPSSNAEALRFLLRTMVLGPEEGEDLW
jgi:hypothetical protein